MTQGSTLTSSFPFLPSESPRSWEDLRLALLQVKVGDTASLLTALHPIPNPLNHWHLRCRVENWSRNTFERSEWGGNWGLGPWSLTSDNDCFQPYPECLNMELEPWNQWLKYYNTVPITFCNFHMCLWVSIRTHRAGRNAVRRWPTASQGEMLGTNPVPTLALYVQSPESWEISFWLNYPKCDALMEWPAMVWIWFEMCFLEFCVQSHVIGKSPVWLCWGRGKS